MGKQKDFTFSGTKAGLVPSKKELPFKVTTYQVQEYLQKRLDTAIHMMEKNGEDVSDIKDVQINIYGIEAGKNYLPFVVVLPTAVVMGREKDDDDGEEIFNTSKSTNQVKLKKPFWTLFQGYAYDKDSRHIFSDPTWRANARVTNTVANSLKDLRQPKVRSMNRGKIKKVTFIIDPIRVFHDMLQWEDGSNTDFMVHINGYQRRETGQYEFYISREEAKGKNKKGTSIIDDIQRSIMSGQR